VVTASWPRLAMRRTGRRTGQWCAHY
jgi:hypothetical protein